jgi:hypothetical protein
VITDACTNICYAANPHVQNSKREFGWGGIALVFHADKKIKRCHIAWICGSTPTTSPNAWIREQQAWSKTLGSGRRNSVRESRRIEGPRAVPGSDGPAGGSRKCKSQPAQKRRAKRCLRRWGAAAVCDGTHRDHSWEGEDDRHVRDHRQQDPHDREDDHETHREVRRSAARQCT